MNTEKIYLNNLEFLYSLLPKKGYLFPGELGLERTKLLLKNLGSPQEKIKVIHVSGTSGKGSTCYVLSLVIHSLGFKVGLTLSPHLIDIRERVQINNQLISKEKFNTYLKVIKSKIPEVEKKLNTTLTYFEVIISLAFYTYYKEKVDYAIIETGLGGLLDGTNVVSKSSKISIITKIGLDHTHILGKTLAQIAKAKSGIIMPNSVVFTPTQVQNVLNVIKDEVTAKHAKFNIIGTNVFHKLSNNNFSFTYNGLCLPKVHLGLNGDYQFQNASLALACLSYLAVRDKFKINYKAVLKSLSSLEFAGRFSVKNYNGKTLIFDGAHNPQKIKYFLSALKKLYPNEKFIFLVGFKQDKEYPQMLSSINKIAKKIYLTNFQSGNNETLPKSVDLNNLSDELNKMHFLKYIKNPNPVIALSEIIKTKNDIKIVITGSLYLLSQIFQNFKF